MADEFDRLVARLDYPMFVLTARAASGDGERSGCLIGFASQCSIDPPRFAVWVSDENHTFAVAKPSPPTCPTSPTSPSRT